MATMNSYYPCGGPVGYYKKWHPFGDDRQGSRYLYGESASEVNIAAAAMKRAGSGATAPISCPDEAFAGDPVTFEYTFTNLGNAYITFDTGFYLSTDSYISTSNTLLGTNYGAWAEGGALGTYSRTVTIPSNTPAGTYYLRFIVDSGNATAENNETNNAQPCPKPIRINVRPDSNSTLVE